MSEPTAPDHNGVVVQRTFVLTYRVPFTSYHGWSAAQIVESELELSQIEALDMFAGEVESGDAKIDHSVVAHTYYDPTFDPNFTPAQAASALTEKTGEFEESGLPVAAPEFDSKVADVFDHLDGS